MFLWVGGDAAVLWAELAHNGPLALVSATKTQTTTCLHLRSSLASTHDSYDIPKRGAPFGPEWQFAHYGPERDNWRRRSGLRHSPCGRRRMVVVVASTPAWSEQSNDHFSQYVGHCLSRQCKSSH